MVLLLPLDISHHRIHMAITHAERAITVLPTKMMDWIPILLVDPSRRARFHRPHHLRQIHLLAQQKQDVHMVCGAAHLYGLTPVVIEYLRHIRVHLLQIRLGDGIRPPFGGKNQMDVYLR